jgi:hypothetical protein
MADTATTTAKKHWMHEKLRADYFAHPNYAAMCQAEADALDAAYPELVGVACACSKCTNNSFPA